MITFLVYTPLGNILRSGYAATEADARIQAHEGESVLINVPEDIHPNTHWVDHAVVPTVIRQKTLMPYDITGPMISGLPGGAVAVCEGVRVDVPDGTLIMDTDLPGTYQILLTYPLYLDTWVEVTV